MHRVQYIGKIPLGETIKIFLPVFNKPQMVGIFSAVTPYRTFQETKRRTKMVVMIIGSLKLIQLDQYSGRIPLVDLMMIYYIPFSKPWMEDIFLVGTLNLIFQVIKQKTAMVCMIT